MKNVTFLHIDFPVSELPQHIQRFFINTVDGYSYIQKINDNEYEFRQLIYADDNPRKNRKDNDVLIEVITQQVANNIMRYIRDCNEKTQQSRVKEDIKLKLWIDDNQNWLNTLPSTIAGLTRIDDVLVDKYHNVLFNLLDNDLIFKPLHQLNDTIQLLMEQEDNGIGD